MKVLVACECSGRVREAFRTRGHDAWSVDLVPSEQPSPYHVQCDVTEVLADGWDLLIAHPPCQYLALSGIHWNNRIAGRSSHTDAALAFVRTLLMAPIAKIALENPVGVISSRIRKWDQKIQPWEYGHAESKLTCLWLKGLPPLLPTRVLTPTRFQTNGRPQWDNQTPSGQNKLGPSPQRAAERARTYQGIADAMAAQWGTV